MLSCIGMGARICERIETPVKLLFDTPSATASKPVVFVPLNKKVVLGGRGK